MRVDKVDDAEANKRLLIRYRDRNRMFHQFDMTDLLELYLTALTAVDPHTNYMGARMLEDHRQTLHLARRHRGLAQSEDGYAVVKEIVPGMAADKDGRLQPEDKIIGIEKEDGE